MPRFVIPLLLSLLAAGCAGLTGRPTVVAPPSVFHQTPPPAAQALWQQAEQQQAANKLADATATLERIVQKFPDNAIAARSLSQLGKISLTTKQPTRALNYYDYLIRTYPQWEDAESAQVEWLRALWATGDRKAVFKYGDDLRPRLHKADSQVALSLLMADCCREQGRVESGFEWLSAGFAKAENQEQNAALTQATQALLRDADQRKLQTLLSQNRSPFMAPFLEFRLAQWEEQTGRKGEARSRLVRLEAQTRNHPLGPSIQAALSKTPAPRAGPPAAAGPSPILPVPAAASTIPFNPYRIGCLVPVNGQYAPYGRQVVRGVTMAADDYNQLHPQQPVSIVVKDTQDDAAITQRSFRELTQEQGVLAAIGPMSGLCTQAIAQHALELGVPLLTLTQPEDDGAPSPYLLHVFLDNRQMLQGLVQHCRKKLSLKRFAVLYPNDRYGTKMSKAFAEAVQESGGSLLASVSYPAESTSFEDPIQKLVKLAAENLPATEGGSKVAPFEALFIPDQARTVALIAPQLPYYNVVGVRLLGTNLWANPELLKSGGIYVEQAIFPAAYHARGDSPKSQRFEERFKELYQTAPSYLEAQAHDALSLLLTALDHTPPPLERAAVLEQLLKIKNYPGLTGLASFSPDGRMDRRYRILQISDGAVTEVGR